MLLGVDQVITCRTAGQPASQRATTEENGHQGLSRTYGRAVSCFRLQLGAGHDSGHRAVHGENMDPQLDRHVVRGQEIRDRLDVIRERLDALALARVDGRPRRSAAGQLPGAAFQAEAEDREAQAAASLIRALYWAARAHERTAQAHEAAVTARSGDLAGHQQRADFHRAAAAADDRRAAG